MIKKRVLMALSVAVVAMASTAPAALANSSFKADNAGSKGQAKACANAKGNLPFTCGL